MAEKPLGKDYLAWRSRQPHAKVKAAAWNVFGTASLHKEYRASLKKKTTPAKKTATAKPVQRVSLAKSRTPRPIPADKKKKATVGERSVLGG